VVVDMPEGTAVERTAHVLDELTAHLEVANITYTSRVDDAHGASSRLFNNPNKSFTMQVSWLIFIIAILAVIFSGLPVYLWKTLSVESEEDKGKKPPSSRIVDFLK